MGALSRSIWNLKMLGFDERGELEYPEMKPLRARTRTNSKVNLNGKKTKNKELDDAFENYKAIRSCRAQLSICCRKWFQLLSLQMKSFGYDLLVLSWFLTEHDKCS